MLLLPDDVLGREVDPDAKPPATPRPVEVAALMAGKLSACAPSGAGVFRAVLARRGRSAASDADGGGSWD